MESTTYTERETRLAMKTIELGRAEKIVADLWTPLWEEITNLPGYPEYADARDAAMTLRIDLERMQKEVTK